MSLLYIYDDIFLGHETGEHPENKHRLEWINLAIDNSSLKELIKKIKPRKATVDDICLVHPESYYIEIESAVKNNQGSIDADTILSKGSLDAALHAVGAGLTAADEIIKGNAKRAFCAVRPPGHHAETNRAMGFCLFSNISITARYLQEIHKIKKIMIIDFDVHHGNGTEQIFYEDNSVFYISTHQYPHFPGTGALDDRGTGKGLGYNRNFPMRAFSGDDDFKKVYSEEIVPIIKKFAPEFILISSGFDGHKRDFLSSTNISSEGFGEITKMIVEASSSADGRIISYLEGGYEPVGLTEGVLYHMRELL